MYTTPEGDNTYITCVRFVLFFKNKKKMSNNTTKYKDTQSNIYSMKELHVSSHSSYIYTKLFPFRKCVVCCAV